MFNRGVFKKAILEVWEDPFELTPLTFGHCPPTHPHSTGHSGAGPDWALWDQFETIHKITVVAVNKCPKPSGQAFRPPKNKDMPI